MRFNIIELLQTLGFEDNNLYWGKRIVKPLPQPGTYKNHSVVANWLKPEQLRLELRAGLSGKTLATRELANYPLQFQSDTFFELDVVTDDDSDDKKGQAGKTGKGGGGGRRLRTEDLDRLSGSFFSANAKEIPTTARLSRGVVMGMEIGRDALENVFGLFCQQVRALKVLATDLLASAGKAITRYTPPPFMEPRGNENKVYKYDREKNETMFGASLT